MLVTSTMTCNLLFKYEAYKDHGGEAVCSDGKPRVPELWFAGTHV